MLRPLLPAEATTTAPCSPAYFTAPWIVAVATSVFTEMLRIFAPLSTA